MLDSKQFAGGKLKQVGTAVSPMVAPKQISALLPLLAFVDSTQSTGSIVIFDRIDFTATTSDADGRTTTGVDLYESGVFVTSLRNVGVIGSLSQTWTGFVNVPSSGGKSYTVRRLYSGGFTESAAQAFTVLGPLAPNAITTATLLAWYRASESFRLFAGAMLGTGTTPRTVSIATSGSVNGRTYPIRVDIKTTGLPGTGTFQTTRNGGVSYIEGAPVTIPTGGGTYAIPGTDLTLTFQQAVSYNNDNQYFTLFDAWLDKVGAYPASGNNFINDASSGGSSTRPVMVAAEVSGTGAPMLRFTSGLSRFMWNAGTLASNYSGADKKFYVCMLVTITTVPSTINTRKELWCCTNLTDTDLPRDALGINMGPTAGQPPFFKGKRVDDAGVSAPDADSGAGVFADTYLTEDQFDAVNRRIVANGVDMVGGDSGYVVDQSGRTITPTRVVLGCLQTQAGKSNFGDFDLAELFFLDQPLSELEQWRVRANFHS